MLNDINSDILLPSCIFHLCEIHRRRQDNKVKLAENLISSLIFRCLIPQRWQETNWTLVYCLCFHPPPPSLQSFKSRRDCPLSYLFQDRRILGIWKRSKVYDLLGFEDRYGKTNQTQRNELAYLQVLPNSYISISQLVFSRPIIRCVTMRPQEAAME